METKTVIFDHNFWVRFGENLDWYEGIDKRGIYKKRYRLIDAKEEQRNE